MSEHKRDPIDRGRWRDRQPPPPPPDDPIDPPPDDPPVGHPDPIVGTVRADYATGTVDATGPRLLIVCHAGDLLSRYVRDPETVRRHLDSIRDAGYHGVRTWTVLYGSYWQQRTGEVGPGLTPDYWAQVQAFALELVTRELRWLVSQGDAMRYFSGRQERRAFMRQLAETLRDCGGTDHLVLGVDAGNETAWNGEADAERLRDALDAFLGVLDVPIRTLTSTHGEEYANEYLQPGVLRDIHSSRGPWPMPARRVFNIGYEATPHVYTVQSEGPGYGVQEYPGDSRVGHHVSATDHPHEWNDNDPEIGGVLAACHAIGKALYVWFSSPGVISDEPFDTYRAFTSVPELFRRLPRDIQSWRVFHGGEGRGFSPDRVLAVPDNDALDVRCDHAASGTRRVCVIYGPPGTYPVRVVNHFSGVIIDPGTLETHPVEWTAGQVVHIAFNRGRVLVGEIR